jgi:hypothetical protein
MIDFLDALSSQEWLGAGCFDPRAVAYDWFVFSQVFRKVLYNAKLDQTIIQDPTDDRLRHRRDRARLHDEMFRQGKINLANPVACTDRELMDSGADQSEINIAKNAGESDENIVKMRLLRNTWVEDRGEGHTEVFVFHEPVDKEMAEEIIRLHGHDPDPRHCSHEHDCCGCSFSYGIRSACGSKNDESLVWEHNFSLNV